MVSKTEKFIFEEVGENYFEAMFVPFFITSILSMINA